MTQPIRILMVFTVMNRGGAETMVMNYYRNIDRSKVQFDFMVHRQELGAYDDEIESLGGKIYRMMPLNPFTFGKYKKQIAAFFNEHSEYRIIHGHCSELGYFVYKEAARRGTPTIIAHAHNSKAEFDIKWLFRTWAKHRMRRYVTQIFTCGEESAIWLAGRDLGRKAILQRNAIDTNRYVYNQEKAKEIRRVLEIPEDELVIGHVGRFFSQKNHDFLIDIFAEIHRLHSKSRLLLVGDGILKEKIAHKVRLLGLQDYVRFMGSRNDVPDLLQAFDAFLFPSLHEGLSLAMVEAQCSGLPCIISDTIPREIGMTDLVSFVSLEEKPEKWAAIVLNEYGEKRKRSLYPERIIEAGYDIHRNALWLQNYYSELWKKA